MLVPLPLARDRPGARRDWRSVGESGGNGSHASYVPMSKGVWYLPPLVSCLDVDHETCEALRAIARGPILLINYFAYAARWGLRFGDVQFRWLDERELLPDRLLLLTDIDTPTTMIRAELAPLMIRERARLVVSGPIWLGAWLRRPRIVIADGGPWILFFEAHATPLGWRR
jgi:hypothetical protein